MYKFIYFVKITHIVTTSNDAYSILPSRLGYVTHLEADEKWAFIYGRIGQISLTAKATETAETAS